MGFFDFLKAKPKKQSSDSLSIDDRLDLGEYDEGTSSDESADWGDSDDSSSD